MKLLELDGMIGIPSPEASQVGAFHDIIKRDRTHGKRVASKELAYIYYLCSWDSPYASYPEEIRSEKIIKDIFEEEWTPDEAVLNGIKKYKELTENEFKRMLSSARIAAYNLSTYFESIDLTEKDMETGKPINSAKELIYNLGKVGEVMEGIEKLVEMVEKNEEKQNGNRKGVETNKYNE